MQWAETETSFQIGHQKMKQKYRDDQPRLQYIDELFSDPKKALFKTTLGFTNAVVVDVCESLFFAHKSWTSGNSGKSTSLLMAVSRIVDGSRRMMMKPFLYDPKTSVKHLKGSQPANVKFLFRQFIRLLRRVSEF